MNRFNAAFIRTIRSSGGNNPFRHLMIPPYAATSATNAWDNFVIPNDNRIIISIHAYTPYDFALNISGTPQWRPDNQADTGAITYLMDSINRYFIPKVIRLLLANLAQ